LDISSDELNSKNSTEYIFQGSNNDLVTQTNAEYPVQNTTSLKMDYSMPIGDKFQFSTGLKSKFQLQQDKYLTDFNYNEKIVAAYGSISYKIKKCELNLGLRIEKSVAVLKGQFRDPDLSFFPNTSFSYKLSSKQNIQLSFKRTIMRPNIYQLNPQTSIDDPYTVSEGNPFLKPQFCSNIYLEHSMQFNSNYFASRLFYNKTTDAINDLTFINDTNAFETQVHNLGIIHQFGVQFSGALKLGKATFNPYLRLFEVCTEGNSLAKQYNIRNKQELGFESGLSAIVSFKHELSLSLVFQYASPKNEIQSNTFCDALYFVLVEKTFKQKIKIGVVSALPFTKSFIYQGSEIEGSNFYSHYDGKVKLSYPICWLKLSYQFNSGGKKDNISREKEEIENILKKGL
jgi:hypothetical protein